MRDLKELEKYRDRSLEIRAYGTFSTDGLTHAGCFSIPVKGFRKGLRVIVSSAEMPESQGWDHVSVSLPMRTPTWVKCVS